MSHQEPWPEGQVAPLENLNQNELAQINVNPYLKAPPQLRPAAIGRRFIASLIDAVFVFVMSIPLTIVAALALQGTLGNGQIAQLLILGVTVAATFAYFGFQYLERGATLGKKWMRIKVIQVDNQDYPSLRQSFVREIVGKTIGSFFMFGFIWAFFHPKGRAFHDLICGTIVVEDD